MKPKISYYLSHPIQYFSPLLREMNEEFDLQVYYFSDASIMGNMDVGFGRQVKWDIPLLQGYSYTFLRNLSKRNSLSNRMWDAVNPGVVKRLVKDKRSIVIVNGWSYFSNLLTILIAKVLGKKVWLRAENPLNQELLKNKNILAVKRLLLKFFLFPLIDKFLYIGQQNKQFFEYYGAKASQLIFTPYSVDNGFFQREAEGLKSNSCLRKELNLPEGKKIILFVGKYIEKKRPLDIIKAFHLLNSSSSVLVMLGEGNLRGELEIYIRENCMTNAILTGFINQSEISKYYAVADIFVMCSGPGETWGLSVNEAMNFSLPIIISDICGCADDLVKEGENGFLFKMGDINQLAILLQKLLENENIREQMAHASLMRISNYSNKRIVENLKLAIG